jgi:hypothetical protein
MYDASKKWEMVGKPEEKNRLENVGVDGRR